MRRKKIFIRPALKERNGDLSKQWFVEFSQRNPQTDQMQRRRVEVWENVSLNSLPTAEERRALAQKIIDDINEKVRRGWTIFADVERVVYADQLQYAHEARVFKRSVGSNKAYSYWASRYLVEVVGQAELKADSTKDYRSKCRTFGSWIGAQGYGELDITAIDNAKIIAFFTYLRCAPIARMPTCCARASISFYAAKGLLKIPCTACRAAVPIKIWGPSAFKKTT